MDEQIRKELSDITSKLAGLEEKIKAAFSRINEQREQSESVHRLALSMERITHEQERIREEQERQRADVEALKSKPIKRWDALVSQIIQQVVASAAGAALIKFGLGG